MVTKKTQKQLHLAVPTDLYKYANFRITDKFTKNKTHIVLYAEYNKYHLYDYKYVIFFIKRYSVT